MSQRSIGGIPRCIPATPPTGYVPMAILDQLRPGNRLAPSSSFMCTLATDLPRQPYAAPSRTPSALNLSRITHFEHMFYFNM
jgi:hypothetical protein